jgi:ACDE family multidrug resistance protein
VSEGRPAGFRDILRIPEIRAAMLGTFVIMMGFGILSPVLPRYARSFGVGFDAVGVLIASFSLTRLLFDPITGRLIHRFGERRMATLGAVFVGATSILAGLAPTFPWLVAFRAAGGAGSAVFFAAILSFLLRTIPSDRIGRVMSVYYASFNVGIIAGQPFGGFLAHWLGLASPLFIYGAFCALSGWVFWRTIYDPGRTADEHPAGAIRRLPWRRPFVAALAVNAAYLWMVGAVYSTLVPLFGNEPTGVGLSLTDVGVGLAIASATEFAVLYPAGKATDQRGRKAVLVPSFAAMTIVIALFGFASTPLAFLVVLGIFGVTTGYAGVPPAALLSDVVPDDVRDTAVAAFRFAGDLGFVLGPLVAGWAAGAFGFAWAFVISAIPCALALVVLAPIEETVSR